MIKKEHIKLLQAAEWKYINCEFGAPGINPKRPYGNSYAILEEIREITGNNKLTDQDCKNLHKDLVNVLEFIFRSSKIEEFLLKLNYDIDRVGSENIND